MRSNLHMNEQKDINIGDLVSWTPLGGKKVLGLVRTITKQNIECSFRKYEWAEVICFNGQTETVLRRNLKLEAEVKGEE